MPSDESLEDRLVVAVSRLTALATDAMGDERVRLFGKIEGLELALSYLQECRVYRA